MNDPIPARFEGFSSLSLKEPVAPDGYRLFTEPHKWQRLPKASKMWIPSAKAWSIPSDHVSAIPGPAAAYAVLEGAVVGEEQTVGLTLPQESILQEAERLVNGDRQQSYGDATESFERIADFWHTYLKAKLKDTEHISAKDVASMMILMKVSRSVTSDKRDNWVDIAGYAELGSKLED